MIAFYWVYCPASVCLVAVKVNVRFFPQLVFQGHNQVVLMLFQHIV